MGIERTYEEINQKIRSGKAVVLTAEEVLELVAEKGVAGAAKRVDVVTTGTFCLLYTSTPSLDLYQSNLYSQLNFPPAAAG